MYMKSCNYDVFCKYQQLQCKREVRQTCLFFFFFFNFWLCWVFVAFAWSCSSCRKQRLLSSCGVQASHQSRAWALGLHSWSFWALAHRLSSCSAWVQLLPGMWNLPGPGIEPAYPALARGFFSTEPSGKSREDLPLRPTSDTFFKCFLNCVIINV